ncbi:MAG: glycosyltransferase family 9 protein [Puniceicoccales bacterium]|jgi:ADP-heptose:LPS heptosyltransferase|nr:glycosyltransferase family 9 protein [Puniceicoccales bacterium]
MRILIVKPSSLGDIIHAMVVVSALKLQYPDYIIDWVVGDRFFDIVHQSKIASRVIIYERHGRLLSIFRLISEIRQETYDYVFDMQGLARSGLMTFFAKSSHKIGRKDSRECARLAYSKTVTYPGLVHAVDILKEFLSIIGGSTEISGLVKELENIHSPLLEKFLEIEIIPNRLVCVFSESQRPEKEWSFFMPMIQNFLEQTEQTAVVLLGNKAFINNDIKSPLFFDLREKTSLGDIAFLIKYAQLVIANDSGPLHISAALGRPTFGLFTTTDPSRFGPYPPNRNTNMALRLNNVESEVDMVVQTAIEMLENGIC